MSLTKEELHWCSKAEGLRPRESVDDLRRFADMAVDWARQRFGRRTGLALEEFLSITDCRKIAVRVVRGSKFLRPFTLMLMAANGIAICAWEIYTERIDGGSQQKDA